MRRPESACSMEGLVTLRTYCRGRLIAEQRQHNIITYNGKVQLLKLALGQSFVYGLAVAFGENATTQTVDDVGLYEERIRVPLVSVGEVTRVGNWARVTFRARLGKTQGNGFTFKEAALVTKSAPGTIADGDIMLSRVTIEPTAKSDQKYLLLQWQYTFK